MNLKKLEELFEEKDKEKEILKRFEDYVENVKKEYGLKEVNISVKILLNDEINKDEKEKNKNKEEDKKRIEEIKEKLKEYVKEKINAKNKKEVEANIILILKFKENNISYKFVRKIPSIYIFGYYNKYEEMPQITWFCPKCKGKGCKICNFTGKKYKTSIQDEIAKTTNKVFKAKKTTLHGAGREDRDVFCIGSRPMVIEIEEPKNRNAKIKELEKEINKNAKGIKVKLKEFCNKQKVKEIKTKEFEKEYIALIIYEEKKPLTNIIGKYIIKQQTPTRVLHRRADKERIKNIEIKELKYINKKEAEKILKEFKFEKEIKNFLFLKIKTDAGTYIKEFVSSDNNRTKPSLSSMLNTKLKVEFLIVSGFYD